MTALARFIWSLMFLVALTLSCAFAGGAFARLIFEAVQLGWGVVG